MKNIFFLLFSLLVLFSCNKKSEISKDFDCSNAKFKNLEKVEDAKSLFSLSLPKSWKINLYQDEVQSSIFAADTTKQLTETLLIDVTFIRNKIDFDEVFLLKQEQENLAKGLIKTQHKKVLHINKPSIYITYRGKKGKFNYQTCHTFIKINENNFLLAKTEIYGNSLVKQRFCNAFSLIDNIKIQQ